MRIYSLTAGAAGMYCGSCLRDNALAAELIARGHQVMLLPIYTPTLTDEPNVSEKRVFFGGVSVYLEQSFPLFRRTPRLLDRMWDSPWLLRLLSGRAIQSNPQRLGELTVSMLKGEDGFQAKEVGKLLDWLREQPRPDVVNLSYSLLIRLARPIREALGCAVCCTLQGEDLFLEGLEEPYRTQAVELIRANVKHVDGFLAVSEYYADFMSGYVNIPPGKMRVAPLGINLKGHDAAAHEPVYGAGRTPEGTPFTIGYFARVAPEKGLHLLAEAYRILRQQRGLVNARLEAAGYLGAEHKSYLREVESRMRAWGLADEFHYRGVLDREQKIRFLQGLNVLSVPSIYAEPKGIFLLEAMANGVPVVQPRRGAFQEILGKTGGGILVEPDDAVSLADGILSLWKQPELERKLGRAGAEGVRKFYSAGEMARRALEVYEEFATVRSGREARPAAATD